jgi:subtilisin family serine protease
MSNSWSLTPDFEQIFQAYLPMYAQVVQTAMDSGRNGLGVPMFYSSGNENANEANWPARIEGTIAIGATSMCDERKSAADCSPENWGGNYGKHLDFSAPGTRIPSTDMTGSLGYNGSDNTNTFNGTSAACPHAAGVAALMLSVNPNLSADEVRLIMSRSCDRVGGYAYDSSYSGGTWSQELGFGRLNAYASVQGALNFNSTGLLVQEEKPFKLFPNPNDGRFTLESSENVDGKVILFDLQGRQVREIEMNGLLVAIDVSDLAAGGYMVFVQSGENIIEAGTIQKR